MDDNLWLHTAASALARQASEHQGGLTLSQLDAVLESFDQNLGVLLSNGEAPSEIRSYRGYYERLAIGWYGNPVKDWTKSWVVPAHESDYSDADTVAVQMPLEPCVKDLRDALKLCIGATMQGYKGGDFHMGPDTLMYEANWGDTGLLIVGAEICLCGSNVIIEAVEEEF